MYPFRQTPASVSLRAYSPNLCVHALALSLASHQSEKHTFIALSAISPEEKQRWLSGIQVLYTIHHTLCTVLRWLSGTQAVVGDETNLSLHPRAREFEKGGGTFGGTFGAGTFGGGSDAPAAPMESL